MFMSDGNTFPPPYDPDDDLFEQDFEPRFEAFQSTPEGVLLKGFLQWMGTPAKDIIESYNAWVTNEIDAQIKARVVNVKYVFEGNEYDAKVVMEDKVCCKPTYEHNGKKLPLTPENARRLHIPYLATIACKPEIYIYTSDPSSRRRPAPMIWMKLKTDRPHQEICKIPVMLGSILCHLDGITDPERLAALGIDIDDPLGYFIVGPGRSKVILNIQKLRLNNIFVLPATVKTTPYCRVTVLTPTGTKQIQIVMGAKYSDLQLQLGSFKKKGEMGASSKAAEGINILRIIEIYNKIVPFVNMAEYGGVPGFFRAILKLFVKPENWPKVYIKLQGTEAMYYNFSYETSYETVVKFLKIDVPTNSPNIEKERVAKMDEMFADHLFPNIDKKDSIRKFYMLVIMSARLLEYDCGVAEADDRDSWSKNKLASPSESVSQLFRLEWVHTVMSIQNEIDGTGTQRGGKKKVQEKRAYTLEEVANKFKFHVTSMNDGISKAFDSTNWGKKQNFARNNLTDILEDLNPIEIISHITKIDVNAERRTKSIGVRGVKATQCGAVCPDTASDDPNCGIVKNKSITALTTYFVNAEPLILLIEKESGIFSGMKTELLKDYLLVNGVFRGWCNADSMYKYLVKKRREGRYRYAEFVNGRKGYIEIFTDAGRIVRPLAVVEENGKLAIDNHNARNRDFGYLLRKGYVEFVGLAEQERLIVASKVDVLERRLDQIAKKAEEYQIEIARYNAAGDFEKEDIGINLKSLKIDYDHEIIPYDYCELHPIAMVGIAASTIPFMNLNPSARIAYQTKMEKQALVPRGVNPHLHAGTQYNKLTGSQHIIRTATSETIGTNRRPAGNNVIVAVASITGFNQEDALIFNRRTLDSGAFDYVKYIVKDTTITMMNGTTQSYTLPYFDKNSAYRYHAIGEDGLPIKGASVREGDCVIGKIQFQEGNDPEGDRERLKKEAKNVSEYMKVGEYGIIESIKRIPDREGKMYVSVKIRCISRPAIGDKLFFTPSQKVTIGLVDKYENMPFDPETGLVPDVIMNPHAIPSRMTMGLLTEMLYGSALVRKGMSYDATGFQFYDTNKFRELITDFDQSGVMGRFSGTRMTWSPGTSPIDRYRDKKKFLEQEYFAIADIVPSVTVPLKWNKKVAELLSDKMKLANANPGDPKYWFLRGIDSNLLIETLVDDKLKEIIIKTMLPDKISDSIKRQIVNQIEKRNRLVDFIESRPEIDRDYYSMKLDAFAGLRGVNSPINAARMNRLLQLNEICPELLRSAQTVNEKMIIQENIRRIQQSISYYQLLMNDAGSVKNDKNYVELNSFEDIPDTMTVGIQDIIYKIVLEKNNLEDEVRNFEKAFMSGEMRMKSGITGVTFTPRIAIGPARINQTLHIAGGKIQVRSRGKRDEITRQSTRGRTSGGAVKFGNMDLHAILSHGASAIANERMCLLSDVYEMPMCIECGVAANYDQYKKTFICPLSRTCTQFGRATVAYVYKYLSQILGSAGILISSEVSTRETYPEKMLSLRQKKSEKRRPGELDEILEGFEIEGENIDRVENMEDEQTINAKLSDEEDLAFDQGQAEQVYGGYDDYIDDTETYYD